LGSPKPFEPWAEQIGALVFLLYAVPDMPDQAAAIGRETLREQREQFNALAGVRGIEGDAIVARLRARLAALTKARALPRR
jgi:hypothetical protein